MATPLAEAKGKLKLNHYYDLRPTEDDIASGIPNSVSHCAVANALRGAGCGDPQVKTPIVSFNRESWRYRARFDSLAIMWDWKFDDPTLGPIKPMNIVIEVIEARPRKKLGTRASRGLPPKGPHPPVQKRPGTCRPVARRYHELKKLMSEA